MVCCNPVFSGRNEGELSLNKLVYEVCRSGYAVDGNVADIGVGRYESGCLAELENAFVFNFIPLNFIVPFFMAADERGKQTQKMNKRFPVVIGIMLVVVGASIMMLGSFDPKFHVYALQIANIVMAVLSLVAYSLVNKPIEGRPHAFVRGVYSASLLRLLVCMGGVLVYVLMNRANIHKQSVFAMFGIYAVYSATETILLSKTARITKGSNPGS